MRIVEIEMRLFDLKGSSENNDKTVLDILNDNKKLLHGKEETNKLPQI